MSTRLLHTLLAASFVVSGSVGDFSAFDQMFEGVNGASTAIVPDAPVVELTALPPEMQELADWAVDLFAEAGLELPPLRFEHHGEDRSHCGGRTGAHHLVEAVSVIEVCTASVAPATQVMLLHETAHAWVEHALGDGPKAAFQELRGWVHWRDYEAVPWHENGTEQAAEILVWGLIDRPLAMVRIEQNSCGELEAGYRALTGRPPLHGYRNHCDEG